MVIPFLGSQNLQKLTSLDLICFKLVKFLQILRVSFPEILIIAIPEGPLPDDSA